MKKACIVTYCEWSSYGSVMQAIGLKETLKELNIESFIVKDNPAPQPSKRFHFCFSKNLKALLKNILSININKKAEKRYQTCVSFINKNVDIIYYANYDALKQQPPIADYYIAGSDQIWHPDLCKPLFFLSFLPENEKKFSYAVSMGKIEISDKKRDEFNALVKDFYNYSVREGQMIDGLSQLVDKPIATHIDPSFLVPAETWLNYEKAYDIDKPYILVYAIYWDKKFNKQLRKLKKTSKCKIVALCTGLSSVWADKKIYDADCGNFLWLIHNAQAIISSSFHGVAFALNYNKKVAAVVNPNASSRINNLLSVLDVKNSYITNVMDFDLLQYEKINSRIEEERKKSKDYLKGLLINE